MRASFFINFSCSDISSLRFFRNFISSSFSLGRRFFRRQMMKPAMKAHIKNARTREIERMAVVRDLSKGVEGLQPVGMAAANLSPGSGVVEEVGGGVGGVVGIAELMTLLSSICVPVGSQFTRHTVEPYSV
jgi:hypothetical protein